MGVNLAKAFGALVPCSAPRPLGQHGQANERGRGEGRAMPLFFGHVLHMCGQIPLALLPTPPGGSLTAPTILGECMHVHFISYLFYVHFCAFYVSV